MNDNDFPKELSPFKESIEATNRDFLRIAAKPSKKSLGLTESKFGGIPFLLDSNDYPTTKSGEKLILLAQLNFEEIPNLDGFPSTGLLQFFVADDGLYGLNLSQQTDQDTFRLVYFEKDVLDRAKPIKKYDWPSGDKDFVLQNEYSLSFELDSAPVSPNNFKFDEKAGLGQSLWDFENDTTEWYWEYSKCTGHKIGGYPHFTQEDPRYNREFAEHTTLLLQIDSEYDEENSKDQIMWGDLGVANFFIKPDDLTNLNFSNVIYNWDCY